MNNILLKTVLAGIVLQGTALAAAGATAALPNIVVILVDDMGYGDPGCYNTQSKISTPHIDSLASDGMRFTDAHAPGPLCHMSRYGLLTGQYPFRIDVTLWPKQPLIKPGQMTIASLAKSQGYRTAMVGKWHVGFRETGYDKPLPGGPLDCGFDSFFGMRASTDIPPYFYIRGDRAVAPPSARIGANNSQGWSPIQGAFWRAGGIAPNLKLEDVLPRFTDEAIQVIEEHNKNDNKAQQPLMLYLAYPAPHTPWLPSDEFVGKSGAGMYGEFLMMVDAQIGRVLEALREADMAKDTLLVFTSDNGPCWYDADVERLGHDSAGGLRGMKSDAWEAGHRMPFVVRWPGKVQAGSTSGQTICFTDLLATFAAVMGAELPDDAGPDSFDFLPVLTGSPPQGKPIRGPIVMRAGSHPSMMIRSGDWKMISQLGSGGFSKPTYIKPGPGEPQGQLYNLADDLAETKNLYAEQPEIVARLQAEMKRIVDAGRSRVARKAGADRGGARRPYGGPPVSGVDTSTLAGKVMCGYQGWFNCEGDGTGLGWTHWARNRRKPCAPGNVTVDLWPDVSELGPDERYTTGFKHADGRAAEVFSSANRKTVLRHFEWMRDYGIDGAFVQRYANGLVQPQLLSHKNTVLSHVREGAHRAGRAYAVMYDLSGLAAGEVGRVREDWRMLRKTKQITEDPAYLHHQGRPVVAVWGIGFSDGREMIYVAMFDEVDEGTAIFKCTNDPPVGQGVSFLSYDGLPSDHYLRLAGQGGRMLRGELPLSETMPETAAGKP